MLMTVIYSLAFIGFLVIVKFFLQEIPLAIRRLGLKRVYLEFQPTDENPPKTLDENEKSPKQLIE